MAQRKKTKKRSTGLRIDSAPPTLHIEEPELKLDLGCGGNLQAGFHGVDAHLGERPGVGATPFAPGAITRWDLWDGAAWPFATGSVSELHASHVIEHIEAGNRHQTYTGQTNLFMFFFEEAWRVAKPGATFTLLWPDLKSVRAFMDPPHCQFIPAERLLYLDRNWREMNKLDHYLTKTGCDWVTESISPSMLTENSLKAEKVQQQHMNTEWNFVFDQRAVLRCRKA